MSQRLHVGATTEGFYDCVLTSPDGAYEKLLDELFVYKLGVYFGPWRVVIGDVSLWDQVEPELARAFTRVGKSYPGDVWVFYFRGENILHPTADELRDWVDGLRSERRSVETAAKTLVWGVDYGHFEKLVVSTNPVAGAVRKEIRWDAWRDGWEKGDVCGRSSAMTTPQVRLVRAPDGRVWWTGTYTPPGGRTPVLPEIVLIDGVPHAVQEVPERMAVVD